MKVVPILMDLIDLIESSNQQTEQQLSCYAEDFGVLLNKYLSTKAQLTEALSDTLDSELFTQIYTQSTNGILITDTNGIILSANPAVSKITGYARNDLMGQTVQMLATGKHHQDHFGKMWQTIVAQGEWQGDSWYRRKDGQARLGKLHIHAAHTKTDRPKQYVAMLYDTAHCDMETSRLYELANHDALTGLPNRTLCKDRLQQAIAQARRNNSCVGLLFVDLDNFKEINDTHGHAIGDLLLIEFSCRLVSMIRDSDTAARIGGDEFIVIAPGLAHEDHIHSIADKIIHSLCEPYVIDGREFQVGASIGAALYPIHADNPDILLRQADAAMYAAKSSGGNSCRLFDDHLGRSQAQRLDMEAGLRCALAQGHFRLVYQPQINPTNGRIIGVEALLRWDWPDHGTVPPDRFIPIAEKIGLILPIGQWVLRTACLQFASWRRDGASPPRVAVNITAQQIHAPDFVEQVATAIDESGMLPGELEIEITESQLMENLEHAVANLVRLRALGVLIAIDDFGTGYSSLGRIRSLPIDRIKVDRSFIDDIDKNPDAYAITKAIFGMAKALKLNAIAEGVEHQGQAQLLTGIQCDELQGYLFGKPQPPEAIAARLKQQ